MNRIFLVGCPRSGTTLLQSMIASHSNVVSFPETHFFSGTLPFNPVLRRLKLYGKNDQKKVLNFLRAHGYESLNPFGKTSENKRYSYQRWCRKLIEILDKMAACDTEKNKGSKPNHWLEKTPRHLHYISSIEKSAYSKLKFLHILREGKNVIASLHLATKQHPEEWNGERSLKKCIHWWNRDIKESLKYQNQPNHFFVVYQQLLNEPEKVLKNACRFLSVQFEPQMITKFHETAPELTSREELWKDRNTSVKLSKSEKLQKNFDASTIKYITDKAVSVDLSTFYI